ncbi:shikimate kinase [soil metagenome]
MKIFLIGFMGSGKSYWGHKWAAATGMEFMDMDLEIEEQEKLTADEIFAKKGERYFRELETRFLHNIVSKENFILACGGGTPCFHDNMEFLNEFGTTIYLRSAPQNIYQRLVNETEKRPLIKNLQHSELLFYIDQKVKEREAFYLQAKKIIDVDHLPDNFIPELTVNI